MVKMQRIQQPTYKKWSITSIVIQINRWMKYSIQDTYEKVNNLDLKLHNLGEKFCKERF
jgi:hypothetical protein